MELGLLTEILQPLPIPMPDIPMPEEGLEVGVLAMGAAVDDMSIPDIPVAMFIDSMAGLSDGVACSMETVGGIQQGRTRYVDFCGERNG